MTLGPRGRGVPRAAGRRQHRYIQQFRLAVLELECARRRSERRAAAQKLSEIDTRLHELQMLIEEAQGALGLQVTAVAADVPRARAGLLPTTRILSYGGRKP
jgi:hypothetical protein